MTTALIRWCLKNGFLVVLFMLALLGGGYYAVQNMPVDAIPDIGEKQVIVFADWPGRSPQDVDNQVTYPLTTSLTGTPGVKTIRSMSGFGFSMVFVIFKDDVDYYWARSRVLERMNVAQQRLPSEVVPVLGPDATALGQVFWYTVEGEGFDLAELRSIQDWYLRYQLNSVEGVSEVASIGGFVKQYQIDVHPDKLRAHRVTLMDVYEAVRKANIDVGAKVLEKNGLEFFIRGVGFIKSTEDLEKGRHPPGRRHADPNQARRHRDARPGFPARCAGQGRRRGRGRRGADALRRKPAARRRKSQGARSSNSKLACRRRRWLTVVFQSARRAVLRPHGHRQRDHRHAQRSALSEEALMAGIVILIFLLHLRSTAAVLVTLPLSVWLCFILMFAFGVDSNIMSLAGLAIAIGDVATWASS
jgi:Cu(I)/Ag(I) efflux system membrane protein CusA/SilA